MRPVRWRCICECCQPQTSTLYLFIFESPEAEWNAAWTTGTTIMDALAIDDEI
jgi:hypothetical protein